MKIKILLFSLLLAATFVNAQSHGTCQHHTPIWGSNNWWSCNWSSTYTCGGFCCCENGFEPGESGYCVSCPEDCAGIQGGNAVEDVCGVCNGDGSTCPDCEGTPNGSAVRDVCGVCNGDGSTCAGDDTLQCGSSVSGSTRGRPSQVGNPSGEVTYAFTAESSMTITFDLCDSGFDTYIRIIDDSGNEVAGNDDHSGRCGSRGFGFTSYVETNVQAGRTYAVVVEGFSEHEGDFQLDVTCTIVTRGPTHSPSLLPTKEPSFLPTMFPTNEPSSNPTAISNYVSLMDSHSYDYLSHGNLQCDMYSDSRDAAIEEAKVYCSSHSDCGGFAVSQFWESFCPQFFSLNPTTYDNSAWTLFVKSEEVLESYTRMACHGVPNVRYSLADGTPFDWEYNTLDECFEKCNNDPNCLGFLDRFPMDNDKRCAWKNDESTLQPIAECKSDYYKKTVEDETCSTCRIRRNWNGMDDDEKRTYIDTVNIARRDEPYKSQYDALVMSHGELDFNEIHGQVQFLAWHRWFIFEYENILRQITPCITVPYWAWEVAGDNWHQDEIWGPADHQFGSCGHGVVNDGPFSDMILPGTDDPLRRYCWWGESLPKISDLDKILEESPDFESFYRGINYGPHDNVHIRIGGSMVRGEHAGMTPEFFLHHNNVDRIWTNWQLRSESNELAQSSRNATLSGTNSTYTVDDFTRTRNQAGICVEYEDHIGDTSERRRLSTRFTKVNFAVAISNQLPKDVAFRDLLVHTNELSLQVSEDFEAGQLIFAANQRGDSLSDERAHEIAHLHQENSNWGKYIKERKVDTEYVPDSEAKAFFTDIVGITAESVRHALETTHKLEALQAFDRQWTELEQLFSEN